MLTCNNLVRQFKARSGEVAALSGVSFELAAGEFLVIQGPSGSGKSTLLMALGGMLRPTSGSVTVAGVDPYVLPPFARSRFREHSIGFVFQLFHLVPYLNVRQNVMAGLMHRDASGRARVDALIHEFGLVPRARELPATLSAGERQRVALARALAKQPPVILADEPTGNLDPDNAAIVFRHLSAYKEAGGTVVVVTHGNDASAHATRTLRLAAGRIASNTPSANPS